MRNLNRLQNKQQTVLNALEGFEFPITAHSITSLKITIEDHGRDIPKLDVCNKTIQNHIKRLYDCGVLSNYVFRGYQLAANIQISTEVLTILDGNRPYQKPMPNLGLEKGLPINISSYRTLNNIKDNKATAKADSPINLEFEALKQVRGILTGSASTSDPDSDDTQFYRNNTQQDKQPVGKLEQKRKKVSPKKENEPEAMLQSMQKLIDLDFYEAAKQLFNGDYWNYKPHALAHLEREALQGVISKAQFRRIVLLDFAFTSAKLWKDKTVYVGEWFNALKQLDHDYFLTNFNDENHIPHKTTLLKTLKEYRLRIKWAKGYCDRHPEFRLLFPVAYFDKTRKHSFEGGFTYTKKHYKKSENAKQNRENSKTEQKRNAVKREVSNKILLYVRRYLSQACSFEKLIEYVNRLERKHQRDKGYYSRLLFHTLEIEQIKPK